MGSGSIAPHPVVHSAIGLVSGGASSVGHQPPYDLRRKSPHHDPAAAAVAPNYPSGCNQGSLSSNSACAAGPSGYAACMLPARKRPRRACYATGESTHYHAVLNISHLTLCVTYQVVMLLKSREVQPITSSMNFRMKSSYASSATCLRKTCAESAKSARDSRV